VLEREFAKCWCCELATVQIEFEAGCTARKVSCSPKSIPQTATQKQLELKEFLFERQKGQDTIITIVGVKVNAAEVMAVLRDKLNNESKPIQKTAAVPTSQKSYSRWTEKECNDLRKMMEERLKTETKEDMFKKYATIHPHRTTSADASKFSRMIRN